MSVWEVNKIMLLVVQAGFMVFHVLEFSHFPFPLNVLAYFLYTYTFWNVAGYSLKCKGLGIKKGHKHIKLYFKN